LFSYTQNSLEKGASRTVITIVSGLPRSGTSLMMQMLAADGMTILPDFERKPDADNPRGYYEWEPAKLLPMQPHRIDEAEGKAVKVISQLLLSIPEGRDYKVIFLERLFRKCLPPRMKCYVAGASPTPSAMP
jgi:hypothetical protein